MRKSMTIGLIVLLVLLTGCQGGEEESAAPETSSDYVPMVSVTGEVVPAEWATVSAQTGGTVSSVLVEPGDEVAEGDLLIQLDATDAELAVQQAQVALTAAEAELALLRADPLPEEVAVAEAQIEAAQAGVSQAASERDRLRSGATTAEIAAAEAEVAAALAERNAALEAHDQTMRCQTVTQPDGTSEEICPALGPVEEQARYRLHAAEEALAAAQARLDAVVAGEDDQLHAADAAVWAAAAQRDLAQAQLDLLQAEATSEQIAVAQAAVAQAEVALENAQVALARCEIRAPFAGTVGAVQVRRGELVAPNQPLVTLGDLTTLRVETTDLGEFDVARVTVGQEATITFDALPNETFSGRLTRIDPMADPGSGGVNYTAVVELDQIPPRVRWGMTAFVDVEVEE
jgi:multidrug efflux pump subunit AcrA (membrane-fusion protein)